MALAAGGGCEVPSRAMNVQHEKDIVDGVNRAPRPVQRLPVRAGCSTLPQTPCWQFHGAAWFKLDSVIKCQDSLLCEKDKITCKWPIIDGENWDSNRQQQSFSCVCISYSCRMVCRACHSTQVLTTNTPGNWARFSDLPEEDYFVDHP